MELDTQRELAAVDLRNKDFYDNLTEAEQKEFSPYVLMRFTSNVKGNQQLQEWFVEMTNELVNKHHFLLAKNHKALLWKLYACTGVGEKYYHEYLAAGKKQKAVKIEKLLAELHPAWKMQDVQLQASLMDKNDIKDLFDKLGFDKKQRKEYE